MESSIGMTAALLLVHSLKITLLCVWCINTKQAFISCYDLRKEVSVVYSLILQVLTHNHICLAYHKADKVQLLQQTISYQNPWLKMCRPVACVRPRMLQTLWIIHHPSSWMIWWLLPHLHQSNWMMKELNWKSSTKVRLLLKHEYHFIISVSSALLYGHTQEIL